MNELRSCPFCGSDHIKLLDRTAWYDMPHNRGRRAVICLNCGADMAGRNNDEAIRLWNSRKQSDEEMKIAQKAVRDELEESWQRYAKMWGFSDPDSPAEVVKGEKDGVDYWKIHLK